MDREAFGMAGKIGITIQMMLELFRAMVAFLILIGDHLSNLFGALSRNLFMLPTVWLKTVKHVSYLSFLDVSSSLFLAFVAIFQELYRSESPGSIIYPMSTLAFPEKFISMPMAFGVVISALVAHSIFPTIYRGMRYSSKFPLVVGIGYTIVLIIYLIMAYDWVSYVW
jgi:solute carrier family 32 (vesicular inhibitory amino acid transporter)